MSNSPAMHALPTTPSPPVSDVSDSSRSSTPENVPPDEPTTPVMGKIPLKTPNTTPYKSQASVSAVSQHESIERPKGFHASLYGSEAGAHTPGAWSMDAFLSWCFPSANAEDSISALKESQIGELKELLNDVKPGDKGDRERPMYKPLVKSLQYILDHLRDRGDTIPLAVHDTSRKFAKGDDRLRNIAPDLMIQVDKGSDKKDRWPHALGLIEVKPNREEDPARNNDPSRDMTQGQTKTWNQLQEYGAVAFQARPRCYMLGMGIYDDIARFYRWDRSAVIFSESFHYKTDFKPLVQFLHGFATFCGNTMGIDSSITTGVPDDFPLPLLRRIYHKAVEDGVVKHNRKFTDNDLPYRSCYMAAPASPTSDDPGTYVTVGGPLFSSRSLFGRGTKTWLAVSAAASESIYSVGKEMRQCVVIKDAWRDADRLPEKDIYARIHEKGHMFGVARCRGGFDVETVVHAQKKESHHTCAPRVNAFLPEAKFCPRTHYRVVLESVGIPLSRFTSTRQLVKAVRDAVKGLRDMAKAGILHRDISINNIMISASRKEEHNAWGFLIDPEYASFINDKQSTSDLRRITGTIQFISIALQRKTKGVPRVVHQSWHDLESVYWVVLHTVVCHVDTNIMPERVHEIFDHSGGYGKHGWLSSDEWSTVEVIDHPPLTRCLHELGRLVHSHHMAAEEKDLLTHERVLKAFEDTLRAKDWPKADPAAREFVPCNDPTKQRNLDTSQVVSSAMRSAQASGISDAIVNASSASRKRKAGDDVEVHPEAQSSDSKRSRV
ncbi:hypothetical protein GLOTRDRAFT_137347 [Gloeophyllum trabeum ATCC 11539]|uniref:Fungal-type protein kinase domain-containing protein n=1 Tax=Gloeophyllum trabeum (strain ATCC 11539 / FP-39264 / Madison 617) TaxID=670483 RepID=S7RQF6_GLOTA|nr:uncharacterized protein GLOTRDRAFT_137347 [Gloeophyllum trabeum ATCC 11539]EPQ56820.1 hypothetical protein GLOTRDRAFT_137347 [Gloeophyllum trabeum ATCC 11539]